MFCRFLQEPGRKETNVEKSRPEKVLALVETLEYVILFFQHFFMLCTMKPS